MKQTIITYDVGGYDSSKPNNNIVEQYEVEIPDTELTEIQMLQAQIDALIILLAQEAT